MTKDELLDFVFLALCFSLGLIRSDQWLLGLQPDFSLYCLLGKVESFLLWSGHQTFNTLLMTSINTSVESYDLTEYFFLNLPSLIMLILENNNHLMTLTLLQFLLMFSPLFKKVSLFGLETFQLLSNLLGESSQL